MWWILQNIFKDTLYITINKSLRVTYSNFYNLYNNTNWIYFFGPRLKTGGTYRISLVRPSVCVSVCVSRIYLNNRSEDFSEIWHKVGGQKCKKNSTAGFFEKNRVLAKNGKKCQKWPKNAKNGGFWHFAEERFRGFFSNFAKKWQKIALPYRTIVSPEKRQFFEFFTEL